MEGIYAFGSAQTGLDEKLGWTEAVPGPSMAIVFEFCIPGVLFLPYAPESLEGVFLRYRFLGPCPRPSESESSGVGPLQPF